MELGTPLADVITDGAAVLIGGYHGTWLPMTTALTLTLDNQALGRHHAAFGAGVLAVLPHRACGLIETARVTRYLAAESAGQCTVPERAAPHRRGDGRDCARGHAVAPCRQWSAGLAW